MIRVFFFFNGVASTDIYTLSLHDALPILKGEIHREGGERASPGPGARAAAPLQRRLDAPAAFPVVPQPEPEPVQRGGKEQVVVSCRGVLLEPVRRGPQVADVLREPLLPPPGVDGEERVGGLGTGEEELRMPAPEVRRLARLLQPLPRELSYGLQHAIARLERFGLEQDEGLVHETAQQVKHVSRGYGAPCSDRLYRVDRESPGEHREPPEQDLLLLGEQRVAPLDRAAQSTVVRQGRPAA